MHPWFLKFVRPAKDATNGKLSVRFIDRSAIILKAERSSNFHIWKDDTIILPSKIEARVNDSLDARFLSTVSPFTAGQRNHPMCHTKARFTQTVRKTTPGLIRQVSIVNKLTLDFASLL